jgi:hypothetical protein
MKTRSILIISLINLMFALLESSFFNTVFDSKIIICLVFAFCIALFVADRVQYAYVSALIGGLLIDFLGVNVIGITPVILIASLAVFTYVKKLFLKNLFVNIFFIYLMNIIYILLTIEPRFSFHAGFLVSSVFNLCIVSVFVYIIHRFSTVRHGYRL